MLNALCFSPLQGCCPGRFDFLSFAIILVDKSDDVLQYLLAAADAAFKQVLLAVCTLPCTTVVQRNDMLQQGHTLVVQHVRKQQHCHIVEVGNRLKLVRVSKQHSLTCINTHNVTETEPAVRTRCIHKLHSLCKLMLQGPFAAKAHVVHYLAQRRNHALAHRRD